MERNMNIPAVIAVSAALAGAAAEQAVATHPHPEAGAAQPELRQATDQEKLCADLAAKAFDGYGYTFNANKLTASVDPQNPSEYKCNPSAFDRTTTVRVNEYAGDKFVKHLTKSARVLTPAQDGGAENKRTVNVKRAACGRATRMAVTSVVKVPGTSHVSTATFRTKAATTNCTTRRIG